MTEGRTITQIARERGITDATMSTWVKAAVVPVWGRHAAVRVDPG